jgi:MbtH protein
MTTNPFEDESSAYSVLVNDEGQYSLWPNVKPVPKGWKVNHKSDRKSCILFIEQKWTDMRPRSLIVQMNSAAKRN